jgi:pimeloyl-ACP methyl ester carboxylesterase
VKLRLYHHHDGARIAYREAGTGPPLALLHSAGLTHREFEPLVEELGDRFRLVLPDLPLHGDSEDRPRHAYTPDWIVEVVAGFIRDTCGPRPLVGGHDLGALIALRAVVSRQLQPSKLILLPSGLHRPTGRARLDRAILSAARLGALPGMDRLLSHAAKAAFRPAVAKRMTARGNPAARDLIRHATVDLPGNTNRMRAWARAATAWDTGASDLLGHYQHVACPTLLLWADEDALHPQQIAEEALDLLPRAQLRVLPGTGFLMAYDDPVGLAREIAAYCVLP